MSLPAIGLCWLWVDWFIKKVLTFCFALVPDSPGFIKSGVLSFLVRALIALYWRDFCLAHGLEERVLMPGRLGNVSEWYARADLFVLSSRYEGFPNVLAEAMAAGLPVVSSNCPTGPSDLVHNGVDGILVPVGDTDALAEALDLLMRNALLRQSLGATGRQIGSRLDLGRIAACWESLFRQFGVEL